MAEELEEGGRGSGTAEDVLAPRLDDSRQDNILVTRKTPENLDSRTPSIHPDVARLATSFYKEC